jgi:putative DNA methylase
MNYPKRLIEVDLPIKKISAHATREKSIRHGHISTLHIWWARRPLAACRAILCAALWPDPADPLCPPTFREDACRLINDFAAKASSDRELSQSCSHDTWKKWQVLARTDGGLDPQNPAHWNVLRFALLDFIADFSNWDNSSVPEYVDAAQALTQSAHVSLGGLPGTRPLVVDPFAGGGSIPLEALRVGADAFASDLNPVPVLLNKIILEYIPKYGQRLADAVREWGDMVQDEVGGELEPYYPASSDGDVAVAYLWARTIISEAPGGGDAYPVEVPLLRSMWLAKASSQDRALRWRRDPAGNIAAETVEVSYADGTKRIVRRPLLEIFTPAKTADVSQGTVARGSVTCPVTGFTTPVSSIRKQLKIRTGGTSDARLIAIRQSNPKTNDRSYRAPTILDENAAAAAKKDVETIVTATPVGRSLLPEEPLPPAGGLGFRVQPYGILQWKDLFAPRQQLALIKLTQSINRIGTRLSETSDQQFAVAVQTCLALALGRLTDFCSSLCTLNATGNRGVFHTFARQALPMVWDFMETAPLNRIGANWIGGIESLEDTIRLQASITHTGQVQMASAADHPLPDDMASAVITDPPYYDAVPYSDLSDYFYVWLKRTLPSEHGFVSELTPKAEECIVDTAKGKDRAFFEAKMAQAMNEARRMLAPQGIAVVVFAHKSTSGWEAQLQAIVDAGWIITGSWPIDTERPGRLRAQGSAALQSSVHLVCRPRKNPDDSLNTEEIGDWRDVLAELPKRIHDWMPRLQAEGVVGADAIFACLGPALEIFSRYSRVEKPNGDQVTLKEYLEYVWAAVSKEAISMIFKGADTAGFEEDARLTAMWLWTLSPGASNGEGLGGNEMEEADEDSDAKPAQAGKASGFVLEYDAARKIAQGLGAHLQLLVSLVEIKGETARLLPVSERMKALFGKEGNESPAARRKKSAQLSLPGLLEELEQEDSGWTLQNAAKPGSTMLDRLHQAMILFAAGRGEGLRRFLVDDGVGKDQKFWSLAQSLCALYPSGTDERRWSEGVLARKKGLGL